MEKFNLNFRYPSIIIHIILFGIFFFFSFESKAENNDSLSFICKRPTFTTRHNDVTSPTTSDGRLLITTIDYATHYEIIEGTNTPFDFAQSVPLPPQQFEIEIKFQTQQVKRYIELDYTMKAKIATQTKLLPLNISILRQTEIMLLLSWFKA
jgi:hypothetical protein